MSSIKPGGVVLKSTKVLGGLLDHRYQAQLKEVIDYIAENYGIFITESYRRKRHANDLHGTDPVRAVDIRTWCYMSGMAEEIRNDVNGRWEYDPDRPRKEVAVLHDAGFGVHLHLQVHPNTRLR